MVETSKAFRPWRAALERACLRFSREERGSILVFGLMILVLMLVIAGTAVDLSQYEAKRTKIQATLDTAVLAAANLNQTLDPTAVVEDYMNKAGLSSELDTSSIEATRTLNASSVEASANVSTTTNFMHLVGVDNLASVSGSTAQEQIGNVEISLVLDNSGSMGDDSKIQNLRTAAKQFIDTMFTTVDPDKLSMSIISYSSGVNVGPSIMGALNTTNEQTVASCIDFPNSAYSSTAISTTTQYQRSGYFDPWDTGSTMNSKYHPCPLDTTANRVSVFFSQDQTTLDNFVTSLNYYDNTSIDLGVKWGAAALDPSMQPVVTQLINEGKASSNLAGRPAAYSDTQTLKVIVVMSDGEDTARYYMNPSYLGANSIYWYNATDKSYSIYDASEGSTPYWSSRLSEWLDHPYGNGTYQVCSTTTTKGGNGNGNGKGNSGGGTTTTTCTNQTENGTAVQWSWAQVWATYPVYYFFNTYVKAALGSSAANSMYNTALESTSATQMDSNLSTICAAAKANNVTIYSIGFETTSHGAATLSDCATSANYYFDVSGTQISDAFSSIANNINLLRLVQ